MILISIGCSKKEREPLEKYSDIFTVTDLRTVISYPGIIEKKVVKAPEGVHINFYVRESIHKKKNNGSEIFIAHIEYLMSSEKELIEDMKTSETISGIGGHAWYDSFKNGSAELIFYIPDKNILVGLEGYTKGEDFPPSTFIKKEGFIRLAKLIEERLK